MGILRNKCYGEKGVTPSSIYSSGRKMWHSVATLSKLEDLGLDDALFFVRKIYFCKGESKDINRIRFP
jgi:hypothetical protein